MSEWAYKFTPKKRSRQDTIRLVDDFGFVARSAYKRKPDGKPGGAISNVKKIHPDDMLHLYYVKKRGDVEVVTVRILDPASFGKRSTKVWPDAPDAALAQVNQVPENDALIDFLRELSQTGEGYSHDPKSNAFTGWFVERIEHGTQPRFADINWHGRRGRHTLVRVERDTLESRSSEDALLSRVVLDSGVMGGKPCIRGTRVTVGAILRLLSVGESFNGILADYPYLQELDLRAALAYAALHLQGRELSGEAA